MERITVSTNISAPIEKVWEFWTNPGTHCELELCGRRMALS